VSVVLIHISITNWIEAGEETMIVKKVFSNKLDIIVLWAGTINPHSDSGTDLTHTAFAQQWVNDDCVLKGLFSVSM
jgi:hypothetical protein